MRTPLGHRPLHLPHDPAPLEPFFVAASLLLLFATSFTNPVLIVGLSVAMLAAGSIFIPHLRRRGLFAAGLALVAAVVLVRLAQAV